MTEKNKTYKGILSREGEKTFLLGENGEVYFENEKIWGGYLDHWKGQSVYGRLLPQRDHEDNLPIVIIWPNAPEIETPFVELYYNERLVKYWASSLGHNAINVNGQIFNYSHLLNENEIISAEEYFFRPAVGEFAPSPNNSAFEVLEDGRVYYDKFGRNFMRTIHVVRVEGLDTNHLSQVYCRELDVIHSTKPNPKNPEKYPDFNLFTRSCSTIIRDGLNEIGLKKIKGIFPLDLFVNSAHHFLKTEGLTTRIYKKSQLKVAEAPS
ncbi:MAG: hypothetical protein MK238_06925, partial [Nitrospinales bacterium]|nr:hypothetical protein [Nitrospinales bacterium]